MSYEFGLEEQLPIEQCPYCGINHPTMVAVTGVLAVKSYIDAADKFWRVYGCKTCGSCVMAYAASQQGHVLLIEPKPKTYDDAIPERARLYLKEANDTLHAPSASVMVATSAVDEMLKAHGIKHGSLYKRIRQAAGEHLITDEMCSWAYAVRLEPNDQRHANEDVVLPDSARAANILRFAEALAEFLFVLPSKVSAGVASAKEANPTDE